jgi:hypothetical protein
MSWFSRVFASAVARKLGYIVTAAVVAGVAAFFK